MQAIYKIFSDNGSLSRTANLKSGLMGIDQYQDGYFTTEAEAKTALSSIAEIHRLEGRKVYPGVGSLPKGYNHADCAGYLLVVDKVDREWRWWIQRIMPSVPKLVNCVSYSVEEGHTWETPSGLSKDDASIFDYAKSHYGYLLFKAGYRHRNISMSEFAKLIRANFDNPRAVLCADFLESIGAEFVADSDITIEGQGNGGPKKIDRREFHKSLEALVLAYCGTEQLDETSVDCLHAFLDDAISIQESKSIVAAAKSQYLAIVNSIGAE